jgi:ferrous iron transport protein A
MTKYLSELEIGETGIIAGFDTTRVHDQEFAADLEDRLLEIGFEEGISAELLHVGPIGRDPLAVKVGTMTVALRRMEADAIICCPDRCAKCWKKLPF